MRRARIALSAGMPLALLCGFGSLGTVGYAQDGGIFDRDRDSGIFDRDDSEIFDRDRPVFEQNRDRSELPFGATLLHSADTECQGALLASGIGRYGGDVHGIRQGEERVFALSNPRVPWACLGETSARADVMECPNGTTDVRISHDGNVARFECYGEER